MSETVSLKTLDLGLGHALEVSRATAHSFDRLTRQHYAVAGDLMEFALAQWSPLEPSFDSAALMARRSAAANRLMASARSRADEYVEILSSFGAIAADSAMADATPDEMTSTAIVLPDDSTKAVEAKSRRARGTKVAAAQAGADTAAGGKPAGKRRPARNA